MSFGVGLVTIDVLNRRRVGTNYLQKRQELSKRRYNVSQKIIEKGVGCFHENLYAPISINSSVEVQNISQKMFLFFVIRGGGRIG